MESLCKADTWRIFLAFAASCKPWHRDEFGDKSLGPDIDRSPTSTARMQTNESSARLEAMRHEGSKVQAPAGTAREARADQNNRREGYGSE
jgi:hypothetical protein